MLFGNDKLTWSDFAALAYQNERRSRMLEIWSYLKVNVTFKRIVPCWIATLSNKDHIFFLMHFEDIKEPLSSDRFNIEYDC